MTGIGGSPVIFLGIADHVEEPNNPFPIGAITIFQFSQHKGHIIYPAFTQNNEWIFVIDQNLVDDKFFNKLKLIILDEEDNLFAEISFSQVESEVQVPENPLKEMGVSYIPTVKDAHFILLHCKIDSMALHPGKYIVFGRWNSERVKIGEAFFHYIPVPPLTVDQIEAIKSDPNSVKAIKIDLGCKKHQTKLSVYTGLERQNSLETQGSTMLAKILNVNVVKRNTL